MKLNVVQKQQVAEDMPTTVPTNGEGFPGKPPIQPVGGGDGEAQPIAPARVLRRFHGTVRVDPTRVGRDAGCIADEVIAHLVGLVGSEVSVTLEIEAKILSGASDNVLRTVTENSRTLNFSPGSGFKRSRLFSEPGSSCPSSRCFELGRWWTIVKFLI